MKWSESHSVVSDSLRPPWTIQSVKFSRPEYWSEKPFPSPGDLPNPDVEPGSLALQADSLPAKPPGTPSMSASIDKLGDWDWHIYSTICKIDNSGGGHGSPLQYSGLENPHGQRSLVCCSSCGHKELDMTEWLITQHSGNLLYSTRNSAWCSVVT